MKWPSINPGEYDNSVRFQTLAATRDSFGGTPDPNDDDNWTTYARAMVKIEPITGRELQEAGKQQGDITSTITVRFIPGVTSLMRIKHETESRIYDIRAVLPIGRNVLMKLLCRERS